ncbi:MAG: hypothetical protein JWO52_6409 [Gammaproteobacteria bacterium]|nr:hypothetical protein [Gammaproteobacteria bacterium]
MAAIVELQGVGDDLQAVVQHAAGIGMVVAFRRGELLDQRSVTLKRGAIERVELGAGERCALPCWSSFFRRGVASSAAAESLLRLNKRPPL